MTRYGMVIDQERCIGCHACVMACRVENKIKRGSWIRVETDGAGMDVATGRYPELEMKYQPVPCMHCANPPCVEACPVGGIQKRPDGIVVMEKEECTGCHACVEACPYGAILPDNETSEPGKCTFCLHRVKAGQKPFCAVCCEGQAIIFGDLDDSSSEVSKALKKRQTFVLKPGKNTGPAVFYAPPMPKRRL